MSINQPLPMNPSKAHGSPISSSNIYSSFQRSSSSPVDHHRRSGASGSFGAGSSSRPSLATPRNNQASKKPHKNQRRPKIADEDVAAENAAMQSTGSRKGRTSITHLMNFSLPPRPHYQPQNQFNRHVRRNPTWGLGSGYHPADKARYIHANYRFIVKPNGDYRAQATESDVHLDWADILQILVSSKSQASNCPICLSQPVAPRMVECGHIFCLPCLIRFMHSTDDSIPLPEKKARWKKCPICYDSIFMSDMRPVRWFTGQEGERPHEGGDVQLRLLVRQPHSALALPRDGAERMSSAEDIPWYLAAEVMDYARIMKGSENYMTEQYESEIEDLRLQEKEDELMFGEDSQWTTKAVAAVQDAIRKTEGAGNPPDTPNQPAERKSRRPPVEYRSENEDVPQQYSIQQAQRSGQSSSRGSRIALYERSGSAPSGPLARKNSANELDDIDKAPTTGLTESQAPSGTVTPADVASSLPTTAQSTVAPTPASHQAHAGVPFYFYEALLHYYLSPLDIRILKSAFGDYHHFPSTLLPRVEHVSTGHIVDDDLRKRAKYLAHLPHGCEVGFLECDWTDVVPSKVLQQFSTDIERRRKKNQEKAIREEKERIKAEKEEDEKKWAAARRRRPSFATHDLRSASEPIVQPEYSTAVDIDSAASSSPPWPASSLPRGPGYDTLASPSTSPATTRTVWGTRVVIPSSPPMQAVQRDPERTENDGWLQNWEADLLRDEELATQVEATDLEANSTNQALPASGGKKKKSRKITLMSTTVRRGA